MSMHPPLRFDPSAFAGSPDYHTGHLDGREDGFDSGCLHTLARPDVVVMPPAAIEVVAMLLGHLAPMLPALAGHLPAEALADIEAATMALAVKAEANLDARTERAVDAQIGALIGPKAGE